MKVVSAELKAIRYNGVDVKIHNGLMGIFVSMDKKDIKFEDLVNHDVHTKVILLTRKCCSCSPTLVLESGVKEEDDKEIIELIDRILELIGVDIKEAFEKENR